MLFRNLSYTRLIFRFSISNGHGISRSFIEYPLWFWFRLSSGLGPVLNASLLLWRNSSRVWPALPCRYTFKPQCTVNLSITALTPPTIRRQAPACTGAPANVSTTTAELMLVCRHACWLWLLQLSWNTLCSLVLAAELPAFAGAYQGKFGQASFNTDDQHSVEEANHPSGMPATHVMEAPCAYQGRFGTTPAAKMCEPRHSGELERKGSAYHGHFGQ